MQFYDFGQVGPGGRKSVVRAFMRDGVRALLPRCLRVLSRSNWTGTGRAIDDMALATCVHGLLHAAFDKLHGWGAGRNSNVRAHAMPSSLDAVEDGQADEDWLEK